MSNTPLAIKNLTKSYADFLAVDDISFTINQGEVFGLLGPNGAGKTTTISCITTLENQTSGSISVFGNDTQKSSAKAKSLLGCVPQELIHHGYFTLNEIMHFYASYYGIAHPGAHIDYILHKLDLFQHRNKLVQQLSGGMKRRLLIAKSLVHKPKLILLDEPTAGVDVELRHNLWDLILQLRSEGVSILLTTHYLEEAEKLCDRLAIIQNGRLLKTASKSELIQDMGMRTISLHLKGSIPSVKHPHLTEQTEAKLTFRAPQTFTVSDLLRELKLSYDCFSDISIQEGNLEDIFTSILKGEVR